MSFTRIMQKMCNDVAVYWGNPQLDGDGKKTFDNPIEVYCRWEQALALYTDYDAWQLQAEIIVFLLQDVDEQGLMYHGKLAALTSTQKNNPQEIESAYKIKRFKKAPTIRNRDVYVRKVYL